MLYYGLCLVGNDFIMEVKISDINKKIIYDQMIECTKKNNNYVDECVSDDDYLLWIIGFLNEYGWCDNDTDISYLNLDKIEKMAKLGYFKEGVFRYAKKNYQNPIRKGGGFCYYLEYKGIIYQLYWLEKVGREACYFSKVNDKEKVLNVINFEDLLNDKVLCDVSYIENMLDGVEKYIYDELFDFIRYQKEDNIPLEAVEERIDKGLKRILRKLND